MADHLLTQLEEAVEVLTSYNSRLEQELEERGELQELLEVFTWQQQQQLWQARQRQKVERTEGDSLKVVSHTSILPTGLQEYQNKLEKGSAVREELKSHIASLPDLSSFTLTGSSSTEGLAPLPSVGDLFS